MLTSLKSVVKVGLGLCWMVASLVMAVFLVQYLTEGAGLQVLELFHLSFLTVLVGLAHVVGFAIAALVFLLIGFWLCASALAAAPKKEKDNPVRAGDSFILLRYAFMEDEHDCR